MNSFRLMCVFALTALPLSLLAADPAAKIPPPASQGTISPSGKFTRTYSNLETNEPVPRTPAEAESALKLALNVKQIGSNTFQIGRVRFDKQKRTVALPARVCIRNQVIEYALVTEAGKAYESLLSTEVSPRDMHLAFLLLGMNASPVLGDARQAAPVPETNAVRIEVSWQTNGLTTTLPLSQLMVLTQRPDAPGHPMPIEKWLYNGSMFDQYGFSALREGSLIALIRDPVALVNNPGADRDNDLCHYPNARLLPAKDTPVQVVFHLREPAAPKLPPANPGVTPVTPLSTNL